MWRAVLECWGFWWTTSGYTMTEEWISTVRHFSFILGRFHPIPGSKVSSVGFGQRRNLIV